MIVNLMTAMEKMGMGMGMVLVMVMRYPKGTFCARSLRDTEKS